MTLTKRGEKVVGIIGVFGFLALLGIAGAIETQDIPTCADFELTQNWQEAWENGCPFQNENGDHLYTWQP